MSRLCSGFVALIVLFVLSINPIAAQCVFAGPNTSVIHCPIGVQGCATGQADNDDPEAPQQGENSNWLLSNNTLNCNIGSSQSCGTVSYVTLTPGLTGCGGPCPDPNCANPNCANWVPGNRGCGGCTAFFLFPDSQRRFFARSPLFSAGTLAFNNSPLPLFTKKTGK